MQTAPRSDMFIWYILVRRGELDTRAGGFHICAYRVKKSILGAENLVGTAKCWEHRHGGGCCDARVIMWEVYLKAENSSLIWTVFLARY